MHRMTPDEIRELQERLGMTNEEFAREVGCSLNTLFRWKRQRDQANARTPTGLYAQALLAIAKELATEARRTRRR